MEIIYDFIHLFVSKEVVQNQISNTVIQIVISDEMFFV